MSIVTDKNMRDINHVKECSNIDAPVEVEVALVFDENPFQCDADGIWFIENDQDFTITEMDPDDISINREDVESDLALKQTEATQIEWKTAIEVQAKHGTPLLEWINVINSNEEMSGRDGKGILAYANGKIHMVTTWYYNKGTPQEYWVREIKRHLKANKWQNPMSGKIKSDTTYSFEFLVENMPVWEYGGNIPVGLGLPKNIKAPTFAYTGGTITASAITINGITITDEDGVFDPNQQMPITYELYNDMGLLLDTKTSDKATSTVTFSGAFTDITTAYVEVKYALNEVVSMPLQIVKIDKAVAFTG